MFGHLKPEEFINLMEGAAGAEIPAASRAHLNSCEQCKAQLSSVEAVRHQFEMEDRNIPEPEWDDFRASVRRELLSRAVQRETALRRWTGWSGWSIRPGMAFGLSLALICVSVGGVLWHVRSDAIRLAQESGARSIQPSPATVDGSDVEQAGAWTNTSVFEQLSNLEEPQAERLRLLIESTQNGVLKRQ